MFQDFSPYTSDQKRSLSYKLSKILKNFEKKRILRDEKQKLQGKILMDKQILEEIKRRNEENNMYYQEQKNENKENADKKESFIKQFEKKFNEVEIFVQREAKIDPIKWDKFLTFEILAFISNNDMMLRRRIKIETEIHSIKGDMKEILKENVELKKRDEFIEDISDDYEIEVSKYNTLMKLYKSKTKFLERKSEHLKSVLNNLNCKLENITSNNTNIIKNNSDKPLNKISYYNYNCNSPPKLIANESTNYREFLIENENNDERREFKTFRLIQKGNNNNSNENLNVCHTIVESKENENEKEDNSDEDIHNKSHIEIDDHSISKHHRPECTMHRELWDISCIEQFTDP